MATPRKAQHQRRLPSLSLSTGDDDKSSSSSNKPKGVYVRPSAVIEKGSGFFFPGLEGPRVRLFVGSGLLMATAINHYFSSSVSAFSEALGIFYSLFVLLQGAIETSKEGRIESIERNQNDSSNSSKIAGTSNLRKQWSSNLDMNQKDKVEWVAASFLTLTAATHILLIKDDSIEFWLGVTPNNLDSTDTQAAPCAAALNTVQNSKGGRVAVPQDHPSASLVSDETHRRCIILQRIDDKSCWMVTSNELLATFTKQDLQWLGQLASYLRD